jgi:hypothetical protein
MNCAPYISRNIGKPKISLIAEIVGDQAYFFLLLLSKKSFTRNEIKSRGFNKNTYIIALEF